MIKILEYKDGIIFLFLMISLFFFIAKTWAGFTKNALCEQTGVPSHKREITFLFSILAIIVILWSVMFHVAIPDNVMWFLASIIFGGMGLAASIDIASFFKKNGNEPKE